MAKPRTLDGTVRYRANRFHRQVAKVAEALDVDLIEEQIRLVMHDDPDVKQRALTNLLPYLAPRLKSIEVTSGDGEAQRAFTLIVQRPGQALVLPGDALAAAVDGELVADDDPLA